MIAIQFNSTKEMYDWLMNPAKLAELKVNYPPDKYKANVNLIDMCVEVKLRENDNLPSSSN